MSTIYLAGGCFWGAEHYLRQINGVTFTEVGFANGNTDNPTYKEVYTDQTGYAETVMVEYDPEILSLRLLIQLYFKAIDPTSLNKQGEDEGTRYRTGIYYVEEDDLQIIKKVYDETQSQYNDFLQVEILPLRNFHKAEEYHQDYLEKNPQGYCHLNPMLFKMAREANRRQQ